MKLHFFFSDMIHIINVFLITYLNSYGLSPLLMNNCLNMIFLGSEYITAVLYASTDRNISHFDAHVAWDSFDFAIINKEREMDAIGTVIRMYYLRMSHARDIRSSIPRGLLHSSTFDPQRIPRRPTVQLKIPICRPSSTLPTYSRASLRHSDVFWNSRDSRTHARA